MNSRSLLPLLLVLLLVLPSFAIAQPDFLLHSCSLSAGSYTVGGNYRANLESLLSSMAADDQITSGFYNRSAGQGPDQVHAIGLCRGDVGLDDCRGCIRNATRRILDTCPNQMRAVGHYDSCMLRFSNRPVYGVLDRYPVTFYLASGLNASDPTRFDAALESLLNRLRDRAGSSDRKFATGTESQGFSPIYGLVQCTPDLSPQQCDVCLVGVTGQISDCCGGRIGGRIINNNCNLRFERYPFYAVAPQTESPPPPPPPTTRDDEGSNSTRWMAIIVGSVVGAFVLGAVFLFFFVWKRKKRSRIAKQRSNRKDATMEEMSSDGSFQFDLETIRDATSDFVDGNKLGQGGFGAVYKGTLPNGQDIAVKRLARDSGQGNLEFKNEVRLMANLQHRNLVKLLGSCLEGREKLLIYEFVPNASLDQFIFDPDKRVRLDWESRCRIIGGVARGLVYLHEDSRLRIIHRDLKASNVLLDAEMNPKISDFGMARLFDMDETHGNTSRVVGTHGYIAPEYAIHGQFSMKSDVFSFGVLVLEIVSGRRRHSAGEGSSTTKDLLNCAWRNWRSGTYSNLVDPALGNVSGIQMMRCIHIGLLCVQENVNHRPTMAAVALMLSSYLPTLPMPSKPAFLVYSDTEPSPERAATSWGYSSLSRAGGTAAPSPYTQPLPLYRNGISSN